MCVCACVCVFVKVNLTQHKISHFRVYSSVAFSVSTVLYNHAHLALYPFPQHSHHPKGTQSLLPFAQPLATASLLPSPWTDLRWTFHVNGLVQHVACCVGLLSRSIRFLRSVHMVARATFCSFLRRNHIPLYGCATFCLSIPHPVHFPLGFLKALSSLLWIKGEA